MTKRTVQTQDRICLDAKVRLRATEEAYVRLLNSNTEEEDELSGGSAQEEDQ